MDIQNHFYGHSEVMAAYCGLRRSRHVDGLVQHGWSVENPLLAHFGDFPGLDPDRYLVFGHSSRIWDLPGAEGARERTLAIGAPWLYLLRMLGGALDSAREAAGDRVVVFPDHGTRLLRLTTAHAEFAAEVAAESGPALVCLHPDDAADPAVLAAWTGAGHEVVSCGNRRDPRFLLRTAWLLSRARLVIGGSLSTSVLYAASAGVPVRIADERFAPAENAERRRTSERVWPEFHRDATSGERRTVALAELGEDALLSPGALARRLGWTAGRVHRARVAAEYWLMGPVAKTLRVLGARRGTPGSNTAVAGLGRSAWLASPAEHLPQPLPGLPAIELVPALPVDGPGPARR